MTNIKTAQKRRFERFTLDYVPGSNLLLEKRIGGQWDEQFLWRNEGRKLPTRISSPSGIENARLACVWKSICAYAYLLWTAVHITIYCP